MFPKSQTKKFLSTYETLCPMVVPRSANPITSDDEFILFSVITFKKTSNEFLAKCREQRWTPREFKSRKGGQESEKKELEQARKDERKLWGEALRLGRTAWGEAIMCWMHVLAVRMFVESILRYGLPPMFIGGIVKVSPPSTS